MYFSTVQHTEMEQEIKKASSEPLLPMENETHSPECGQTTPIFVLGVCIGCLVQLATLGGSFIVSAVSVEAPREDRVLSGIRLTALGFAFLIATTTVTACTIIRHFYSSATAESGPKDHSAASGRNDFCFATGLVTGLHGSLAISNAALDTNVARLAFHGIVATVWATTCLVVSSRQRVTLEPKRLEVEILA